MNYSFFHHGRPDSGNCLQRRGQGPRLSRLAAIAAMNPDFFVGTATMSTTTTLSKPREDCPRMRRKWHEQFVQPRFRSCSRGSRPTGRRTTTINDTTTPTPRTSPTARSHGYGVSIPRGGSRDFPRAGSVVDPFGTRDETYRTHRINALLQIWLFEGRDFAAQTPRRTARQDTLGSGSKGMAAAHAPRQRRRLQADHLPHAHVGPDDATRATTMSTITASCARVKNSLRGSAKTVFLQKIRSSSAATVTGSTMPRTRRLRGVLVRSACRCQLAPGRKPGDPESTDPARSSRSFTLRGGIGGFLRVTVRPAQTAAGPRQSSRSSTRRESRSIRRSRRRRCEDAGNVTMKAFTSTTTTNTNTNTGIQP